MKRNLTLVENKLFCDLFIFFNRIWTDFPFLLSWSTHSLLHFQLSPSYIFSTLNKNAAFWQMTSYALSFDLISSLFLSSTTLKKRVSLCFLKGNGLAVQSELSFHCGNGFLLSFTNIFLFCSKHLFFFLHLKSLHWGFSLFVEHISHI